MVVDKAGEVPALWVYILVGAIVNKQVSKITPEVTGARKEVEQVT